MNQLICVSCQSKYSLEEPRWKCDCGGLLDINFTPTIELERISQQNTTLWRYRAALPLVDDDAIISFDEGCTPLTEMEFSGIPVYIKQDHLFASGSYKDRGAAILVSKLNELGIKEVVEDSSGNAGCAIAAYCARARIKCTIFAPTATSPPKLAQIKAYGASLTLVSGNRQATADAALKAAENSYYASHSWNPFFFHGTKTFAYEVCEQLGWQAPDAVVLPVGNGTLLLGAFIGFNELLSAGITEVMPKLIAVQAEACSPLADAYKHNLSNGSTSHPHDTLAQGIAIARPIRGPQILESVKQSGGTFLTVSEEEISVSLSEIGHQGFYIEPTSAAVMAAVSKYVSSLETGELIVSTFTGHGLKSIK